MAQYYISPAGNDTTGNGTSGNPWQTIAKAITSSANGDTINLSSGSFVWPVAQQQFSDRTFIGQGPGSTVVDGGGATVAGFYNIYGTMVFQKIRFTNAVKSLVGNSGFFAVGNSTQSANITFSDCQFDNLTWNDTNAGAMFLTVYSVAAAITWNFTRCVFYGNKAPTTASGTSLIWAANGSYTTVTISNCTFYATKSGSQQVQIFFGQAGSGGGAGNPTYTIKNCIFMESSGLNPALAGGSVTYLNCLNNLTYGWTSVPTSGWSGTITSDPLFVDAASADFRLKPTSPAIDAGVLV